MTQEEIIEENKLIAEFMGYQVLRKKFQYKNWNSSDEFYFETDEGDIVCDKNGREVNLYADADPLFELEELPFNSSWDWLMSVVEKIEKEYWVTTTTRRGISAVSIHQPERAYEEIARFDSEDKLEATWRVVVEFIKWYNKNK